jgi:hypothetical protein
MAKSKTPPFYFYSNLNNCLLSKKEVAFGWRSNRVSLLNNVACSIGQKNRVRYPNPTEAVAKGESPKARNNLFNLKSFNELKKDQTNIKIFKNSSFDSNFNALAGVARLQSMVSRTNLSHLPKAGAATLLPFWPNANQAVAKESASPKGGRSTNFIKGASLSLKKAQGGVLRTPREGSYPKISAILRAIRSIRLNRDEWKLIKNINLYLAQSLPERQRVLNKKRSRSNPLLGCPTHQPLAGSLATNPGKGAAKKQSALTLPSASPNKRILSHAERILRRVGAVIAPSSSIVSSSNNTFSNSHLIRQKSYNKIYTYNNIINKNILLRNMKYNFLKSTLSSILKKKIRRISEILEDKPIKNYVLYSYLKNCIFTPPHTTPSSKGSNITVALARSKLSLNKYKGRKFGSFINYNKIIGFNFNSTFYQPSLCQQNCSKGTPFARALPKGECSRTPLALAAGLVLNKTWSLPRLAKGETSSPTLINKIKSAGTNNPSAGARVRLRDKKEFSLRTVGKSWLLRNPAKLSSNGYIKDTYKLLFYLFKSMYCLISKPVLKYTNDKVTIQLFYYLNIPKKKIFRLFSISYIKSIKKKWLAQSTTAHSSLVSKRGSLPLPDWHSARRAGGRGLPSASRLGRLNIRLKTRKAISRLKNKIITNKNLLFSLRKFNLSKVYQNKFKLICAILSKNFNKPVELQLIRLHHPYHDSNILVNLLSLNIKNKRKKARVAIQKIYNKKPVKNLTGSPAFGGTTFPNLKTSLAFDKAPLIPAFLTGLNIKIAGRLMGEPIIPRITTKVFGKGASATGKVNFLDVARITKKNRKGAYTIKITSGQNFF